MQIKLIFTRKVLRCKLAKPNVGIFHDSSSAFGQIEKSLNGRFQKISIPYHGRLLGFPKGRGGSRLWNSEGMGGIYDWKSEGMGEFHRWDFWSRKCRVSSLKKLLLWTFVVRK